MLLTWDPSHDNGLISWWYGNLINLSTPQRGVFPGGAVVKNLPAKQEMPPKQEMWVRCLGQEDPLEKEMATHSSTLAWKIPWMEEPGRLQSIGSLRVGHN